MTKIYLKMKFISTSKIISKKRKVNLGRKRRAEKGRQENIVHFTEILSIKYTVTVDFLFQLPRGKSLDISTGLDNQ